jgi:hypothetical protein
MQNGILLAIFGISQIGNSYQYGKIYNKFYHNRKKTFAPSVGKL